VGFIQTQTEIDYGNKLILICNANHEIKCYQKLGILVILKNMIAICCVNLI